MLNAFRSAFGAPLRGASSHVRLSDSERQSASAASGIHPPDELAHAHDSRALTEACFAVNPAFDPNPPDADTRLDASLDTRPGFFPGQDTSLAATALASTVATQVCRAGMEAGAGTEMLAESIAGWLDIFSGPYPESRVTAGWLMSDVSACIAECALAMFPSGAAVSRESVASVLHSPYLLQALEKVRDHVIETSNAQDMSLDLEYAARLEPLYLATLRKACVAGLIEPGSVLGLLVGHAGQVSVIPPGGASKRPQRVIRGVASLMHHFLSVRSLDDHTAFEFAGTIDAALRSAHWEYGVAIERARWRRELTLLKGYGTNGSSNPYSVLALTDARPHKLLLVSALGHYDLLPDAAECHEKRSRHRARALTSALRRLTRGITSGWGDADSERWLSVALDEAFGHRALETMRMRHIEAAEERVRRARALIWNLGMSGLGP
ncbi:conserved protein of unknown function [Pararobbsia alpina]|uniref:hypothetical protein n=1 Tax=Pararobbsia alpina TaxID=621374 RepID=UPI0039A63257